MNDPLPVEGKKTETERMRNRVTLYEKIQGLLNQSKFY